MPIRVLLIDDDEALLTVLARGVNRQYEALTARTSGDAERIVAESAAGIDLVVCDISMPDIDGVELRARLTSRAPDLADRFVFMTGGGQSDALAAAMARTACPVLEKPIDVRKLVAYIARRTEGRSREA